MSSFLMFIQICDVDGKILNVNARYPGRVHDQFIFRNSIVRTEMMRLYNHRIGDFHLIGKMSLSIVRIII